MNTRLATFVIGVYQRQLRGQKHGEWVVEVLINGVAMRRETYAMEIWDTPTDALRDFCSRLEVITDATSKR